MKRLALVVTPALVLALTLVSMWLSVGPAAAAGPYTCLPTCSTVDGRMLSISGAGFQTLAGNKIYAGIRSAQANVSVGFFDGNGGGMWDAAAFPLTYSLYAGNGGVENPANLVRTWQSAALSDNTWQDESVINDPRALVADGSYTYMLVVSADNAAIVGFNSFKLRTDGQLSLLKEKSFAFLVPMNSYADLQTLYPRFPSSLTPTTYDGSWDFYFSVPQPVTFLEVWDGDLDFGRPDCTSRDTDDPNTDTTLPSWTAGTPAVPEGVAQGNTFCPGSTSLKATGAPADNDPSPYFGRPPDVNYVLIDATGIEYANNNPSGNLEWERFRVSSDPADASADARATALPRGLYRVSIRGMDVSNLNAWWFTYPILGLDETGKPSFTIGDTVWSDANGDGSQQAGEPGIAGVTVKLLDGAGTVLKTDVTDAASRYGFDIGPGTYTVQVAPENFSGGGPLATYQLTTSGNSLSASVISENIFTLDFGYRPRFKIGDTVWNDGNGDGTQQDGEAGIPGVAVKLLNGAGGFLGSAVTDAAGQYAFDVFSGAYSVTVAPENFSAGGPLANYRLTTSGNTMPANVTNANILTVDFGYRPVFKIGDTVWKDADGDRSQQAGEPGIPGVTVKLLDTAGGVLATAVTNAAGQYAFDVFSGAYSVAVAPENFSGPLANYRLTTSGNTMAANVTNANILTVDFGYRPVFAVGDTVWYDKNGDGVQQAGEPGIAGVTVKLLNGAGNALGSAVTDAAGRYSFEVFSGGYSVAVAPENFAGSGALVGYRVTTSGNSMAANVANQNILTLDFGYQGIGAIGDQVWLDSNGNNAFDPGIGEIGLAGVKVTLDVDANRDGVFEDSKSTTTSATGWYTFTNLLIGNYRVRVDSSTLPGGLSPSYDLDGVVTPNVAAASLTATQTTRTDVDFAYRKTNIPAGLSPGYWKNHPEAWPVTGVTIGGRYYARDAAIAIIGAPTKGDATYTMAQALIAAKLNVANGANAQSVSQTIQQADDWMATHPLGSGVKAGGNDSPWRTGEPYYNILDKFNNGG